MTRYTCSEVPRTADVEVIGVDLALKDIDVGELVHLFWGDCVFVFAGRGKRNQFILSVPVLLDPPLRTSESKELACRVVARRHARGTFDPVRLRQGYGATVFAPPPATSEDWSLGGPFPFCEIRLKWTRNVRKKS